MYVCSYLFCWVVVGFKWEEEVGVKLGGLVDKCVVVGLLIRSD